MIDKENKMIGEGTKAKPIEFADEFPEDEDEQWVACFDYCRNCNRPFVVKVGNEMCQIFPSGLAKSIDR